MANKMKQRYRGIMDRVASFDAGDYAKEAGAATFDEFRGDLSRDVRDLRGSQVGRGRIRTGFGFEEEDRMVSDSYRALMRSIAQQSLQAAGLDLDARNLEGEMAAGDLDRSQADKNARRRRRGGLLGAVGGIAGTLVGGPGVGTYLGGMLGNAAGQYL